MNELVIDLVGNEELAERFMDWFNESGAKAFLHYQSENYPNQPGNVSGFVYDWKYQVVKGYVD